MRRREFVTTASATIATASIAGCSGVLGGDGGGDGSSGPEAAVESYIDASKDADSEAMSAAVHPEGTVPTEPSGGSMGSIDVQSTEVTEETDSRATVVVAFELSAEGETVPGESTYEVRTHEGEWLVYSVQGGI